MPGCAVLVKGFERTFFHAAADVVHHPCLPANVHYNAHMRQPRVQQPGKNVANMDGFGESVAGSRRMGCP